MKSDKLSNQSFIFIVVLFLPFILGTDACTRSYEFAPQAGASPSPSGNPSPSESESESESESPTEPGDEELTSAVFLEPQDVGQAIISSLRSLSEQNKISNSSTNTKEEKLEDLNWLGKVYDQRTIKGLALDSDRDGFIDEYELDYDSDSYDPTSIPDVLPQSKLINRFIGIDDDFDGINNQEEEKYKTNSKVSDTDGDGFTDLEEILAGTDPLDTKSFPIDSDGDGLSDDYEMSIGTDPANPDTDGDGLNDGLEIALDTDPLDNDTDNDGVTDGKEVELGSDPKIFG